MRIKVTRNFFQNGVMYQTGHVYEVDEVYANPNYYEVLDATKKVTAKNTPPARKRQQTAVMKPSEVKKVVMRNK